MKIPTHARLDALNTFPIKSCRGIASTQAALLATGLADDRHWMLVRPNGRFVTQRELPRLSLVTPSLTDTQLIVNAPGLPALVVDRTASGVSLPVTIWKFSGRGVDCGDAAAAWFSRAADTPLRLVVFDETVPRDCDRDWTGEAAARTEFSDGFPVLVLSRASVAELNSRLPSPLPMERFRPNIVLDGIGAYDEDRIAELRSGGVVLRLVKPCTRCAITTTDQQTGQVDGVEPLATLKSYRFDAALRGVAFGQNTIIVKGAGHTLRVGDTFEIVWRSGPVC